MLIILNKLFICGNKTSIECSLEFLILYPLKYTPKTKKKKKKKNLHLRWSSFLWISDLLSFNIWTHWIRFRLFSLQASLQRITFVYQKKCNIFNCIGCPSKDFALYEKLWHYSLKFLKLNQEVSIGNKITGIVYLF